METGPESGEHACEREKALIRGAVCRLGGAVRARSRGALAGVAPARIFEWVTPHVFLRHVYPSTTAATATACVSKSTTNVGGGSERTYFVDLAKIRSISNGGGA